MTSSNDFDAGLVTTQWLADHLNDPDLVVLDCSVFQEFPEAGGYQNVSGRSAFESGHIPGAGFADLMTDLSDPDGVEFAVPSPEVFCAAMGALGVGDDTRVVVYDANGGMWAARVWWMLRWAGFDQAAILDGGFAAWQGEDRPLSTDAAAHPTRVLTPAPRPSLIADEAEVRAAIDDGRVNLIDTLPEASYRGEMPMYGRAGHIPTAVSACALDLYDETGRFRSDEELAELCNWDRSNRHITYCGGGIMASSTAFALAHLGFGDVAVYTASLQEWAADPANPMEVPAAQV